jgi:hypothetical protein
VEDDQVAISRTWNACFLGLALAAGSGGCGDSQIPHFDLPREALSGTVTIDGQPLPEGMIGFTPILEKTPPGSATDVGEGKPTMAASATEIRDGKYEIPSDKGLVPGNYKVSISSNFDPAKKDPATGKPIRASRDVIPKRFGSETELTAQVKKAEPNIFNFEVSMAGSNEPARSKGKTATPPPTARPRPR